MATLISNIEEFKANLGSIDVNFIWESLASFVQDVEDDIIAPFIGDDALALFVAMPADEAGVPGKVRRNLARSEAYLTILKWSQFALFRISDRALIIATTKDGVIPSDKKLTDLRNTCEEQGFNFLDKAITLMESNLDTFPEYTDSGVRQTLLQGFIKTASDFSLQRNINNSRVTFMSMVALMHDAQDDCLPEVMGRAFYEAYKERYLDEDLSPDEKKLLSTIKKAMAFITISRACKELPVKVTGKGLLINSYNDTREYAQANAADVARVDFLSDDSLEKGERKLRELKAYLIENAALYPEFIVPSSSNISPNDQCSGFFIA